MLEALESKRAECGRLDARRTALATEIQQLEAAYKVLHSNAGF